eukprot:UN05524
MSLILKFLDILLGSGKDVFRRYSHVQHCIKIMFSRREWMSFCFNEICKVSNIICQILMTEYGK